MMPTSPQTMPVAMPTQNTTPLRRCPRLYSSNSRRRRSDRRSWVNRSGRSDDTSNTGSTVPMLAPLMTWHSDFAESVNSNGKIALSQVISSGSFWPMPTRPGPPRNSSYWFCGKKMAQSASTSVTLNAFDINSQFIGTTTALMSVVKLWLFQFQGFIRSNF